MTAQTNSAKRQILELVQRGELDITEAISLLRQSSGPLSAAPDVPAGRSLVCYRTGWERTEPPPVAPELAGQDTLVVLEAADGVDPRWCPAGAVLVRVRPEGGPHLVADDVYEMDPCSGTAWSALCDGLRSRGCLPSRLVFVSSPAARPLEHCLGPVFAAVQTLIHDRSYDALSVACVVVGDGASTTVDALGGFCQIAGLEDRRIHAVAIQVEELPPGFADPVRLALAELALACPGSAEVRYDRSGRWVRALHPAELAAGPSPLRERGVYLITGGTGGLALRLAELLAQRVSARLVLLGRSEPTDREQSDLRRVEELGGEAIYLVGDVTRYEDVEAAVARAHLAFGPLSGVLHSAGINEDAYIVNKELATLSRVLLPKLAGARNLDQATRAEPLDFFVLFSSMAAYLGGVGQCDYAAANRALSGIAAERAAAVAAGQRTGVTVSVAWPLWAGGGMDLAAADKKASEILQGMVAMPPEVGLQALEGIILTGGPEALVVYGDTERIHSFVQRRLAHRRPIHRVPPSPAPKSTVDVGRAVEHYVLRLVAGVVRLPVDQIRADQEFSTLGVDSILIKRISAALEDRLGPLPVTLLFEHRTVQELARRLTETHQEALQTLLTAQDKPGATTSVTAGPAHEPASRAEADPDEGGIAIVGIAGRYPGGADLDQFWESLATGRDCITEIPRQRWDNEPYFDPTDRGPGKSYSKWGGFLDDVARFDALFFNIAPREAERMDPAERLFLEVAWSALEDAGYSRRLLHRQSRDEDRHAVGVFVGANGLSYELIGAEEWGKGNPVSAYSMDFSIANRLSYILDVHGPSLVVDTACSASLTAIHLACESLRRGECRMAIAGGVYVNLHPLKYTALSELRMLSRDGRCRAFGKDSDGFVPGEGVGAVILKPLAAAVADGDHINAVIKATAVNHGGKTNGYTVPAPAAQREVISTALRRSGVDAQTIGYIEAHGTGTALGDPIEIDGLCRAFAGTTNERQFCAIGSVKSNIGHPESAAGIAGITKVVLQLRNRTLVPTLHCEIPNPKIDFAGTPFRLQRKLAPWKAPETLREGRTVVGPRRAAVSSFGAGGANAHVILEEYLGDHGFPKATGAGDEHLVVLSAKTDERLRVTAERLAQHLSRQGGEGPSQPLRDIACTLAVGREPLEARLAVTARSAAELRGRLQAFAHGLKNVPGLVTGRVDAAPQNQVDLVQVQALLAAKQWAELGRLWVAGADVAWETAFDGQGRHVPLPTYPFGGKIYWVPVSDCLAGAAESSSLRQGPGAVFEKCLRRTDPVVADHTVGGRAVVPGVAHLELVRAAGETLGRGPVAALSEVRWRVPLEVAGESQTFWVTLEDQDSGLAFRLTSGSETDPTVHSSGHVHVVPHDHQPAPPPTLDLEQIRLRCGERLDGAEFYARASAAGLEYGPSFRCLRTLWIGDGEALAEIAPSGGPAVGGPAWWLDVSLADAALQAVHGVVTWSDAAGETMLPASVSRVELWERSRGARAVHVRLLAADSARGDIRVDVTMTDEAGNAVVAFCDFRAMRPQTARTVPYFRPRWRLRPLPVPPPEGAPRGSALVFTTAHDFGLGEALRAYHGPDRTHVVDIAELRSTARCDEVLAAAGDLDRVYFLGGVEERRYSANDLDYLEAAQEDGCLALFRLAQVLAARRVPGLHLAVVTSGVQQLDAAHPAPNPFAGSLLGLAKAIARELSLVNVSCVDLAGVDLERCRGSKTWDGLLVRIAAEPASLPMPEVAIRGNSRLVKSLEPAVLPEPAPSDLPFKPRGRYLVLGGAGGLGRAVSEYLAREYHARLVLVGRRPADALPERTLSALAEAGGEVVYRQADVSDVAAMHDVVVDMRACFGGVDGVIHSAFVLADRTIAHMDDATFRESLSAKTRGTVVLHHVLEAEPLDFVALFSSGISHTGNPGQANYAAASTFQDVFGLFAASRLRRPVKVFNWGYWGESGSVASDEYRAQMARWEVEPLTDAEGVRTFRQVMGSAVVQVAPLRVSATLAKAAVVDTTITHRAERALGPSVLEATCTATGAALAEAPSPLSPDYLDAVESLARQLILDAFRAMGVLRQPGEVYAATDLASRLGVTGSQVRLLDALLQALVNGGYVGRVDDRIETLPAVAETSEEVDALRVRLMERFPHLGPTVELMADCAAQLEDVLTGARRGIEILFPGGSNHRLTPLYHDDPRARHFNALCTRAVGTFATCRLEQDLAGRLDILEVGAGTGGTSRPVLDALNTHGPQLRYDYTDISPALVGDARERFGSCHPFTEFRVLDIEGDLAGQGFGTDRYDLVLAANVLHATRDIRHTMSNVKRLLRPGGLLVLNESTRVLDCVTLIFGLTDGWWFAHDGELRLPYSPLLSVDQWRAVFAEVGLRGVHAFGIRGLSEREGGQHVIVAERDLWREGPPLATLPAVSRFATAAGDEPRRNRPALTPASPAPSAPPTSSPETESSGLHEKTVNYLRRVFAAVLKIDKDELDPYTPLAAYGMDSLISMEVVDRLEKALGPIPKSLPFEGESIDGIARALVQTNPSPERLTDDRPAQSVGPLPPASEAPHRDEPIAIVGVAGRYPEADDLWTFWDNLRAGRSAIREVPADRWLLDEHYDPQGTDPGRSYHRWGAFLNDVDRFDPLLFRISPRDAERIDPQERLFLETTWAALEDAGYPPRRLERCARRDDAGGVGVFVGVMHGPYQLLAIEEWGRGRRALAHSAYWSIANRVSHCLGFTGPSMAIDTACSSSITALHVACESIRRGDCGAAVVGGVNLILHPVHHLSLSAAKMLSRDGRSRAFAAEADGMVTGEGVGAVILKPLSNAVWDGDRIHGTVVGSSVNASGQTISFVTPSVDAQAELIERALRRSGVTARSIDYVEAQATGSPLADRVEMEALTRVFQRETPDRGWCAIGSLKPNIGHLEAASGMAALTKVLLQMHHGELTPTIDAEGTPADVEESPFRRVDHPTPWSPRPGTQARPRRAAIGSFGVGGAGAQVIVEEYQPTPPTARTDDGRPQIVPLSARRSETLHELASRLRHFLRGRGAGLGLADVAHTLQVGREEMATRVAILARDVPELVDRLTDLLDGRPAEGIVSGSVARSRSVAPVAVPSRPAAAQLAEIACVWAQGASIDWAALHGGQGRHIVSLPTYPFARERYWLNTSPAASPSVAPTEEAPRAEVERHDLPASPATDQVRDIVFGVIGEVLGFRSTEIGLDDHLSDFGFDSVTIVELANRLAESLAIEVSPASLYGYPDTASLIDDLAATKADRAVRGDDTVRIVRDNGTGRPTPQHTVTVRQPRLDDPAEEEPIAVIGIAGAFPGSLDLDAFWSNLAAGRNLVEEIPPARFDWRDIYGDPSRDPNRVPSRWGGFLTDIDCFDPGFFRITPREARLMDPQHRLFLETAWKTIEDAGYDPTSLAGSATGVFVGVASSEYLQLAHARGVDIDGQLATGNDHALLPNRISFLLDLRGPSEPTQTACSSSLVAVHRAVRAIRSGECELAIAGGVNVTLTPNGFLAFGKAGMLASDGRCKAFDHRADGYVRGEGVGAVLLKPLSRAHNDGDQIYALIKGTATNHGGRAASLTAPNPTAQADVIVRAHTSAGVEAETVGYVETHGTGTSLGDPVEFNGLASALRDLDGNHPGDRIPYCGLGSVKSNIGHLEAAAGIVGLIKVILSLHHGMLVPTLHIERVNPLIGLAGTPFYLVDSVRPWDRPRNPSGAEQPRRAGVSSFGFGGANAHVVLEEYEDAASEPVADAAGDGPYIFVLSARTEDRLRAYAERLVVHLERLVTKAGPARVRPADVAYTLQLGRPALDARLAIVATGLTELAGRLRAYVQGNDLPAEVFVTPSAGHDMASSLDAEDRVHLVTLAREKAGTKLAALWVRGLDVDWNDLHRGQPRRRVSLPSYPFARERYWLPEPPPERGPVREEPGQANGLVLPTPRAEIPAPPPGAVSTSTTLPDCALSEDPMDVLHLYVRDFVAVEIGIPAEQIDPERDFAAFGIDSLGALRIMQRIQARYGDHIPMAAILECTNLNRLVAHLADKYLSPGPPGAALPGVSADHADQGTVPEAAWRPEPEPGQPRLTRSARIVTFEIQGDGVPFYCVHGDTGELSWLLHLRSAFGGDSPLFGVEAPGIGADITVDAAVPGTVEEMAEACVQAIVGHRQDGSYRIVGFGLAGLVAIEVVRQLLDLGHEVPELLLIGTPEPGVADISPRAGSAHEVVDVVDTFAAVWGADQPPVVDELPEGFDDQIGAAVAFLRDEARAPMPDVRLARWLRDAVTWRRALVGAARRYQPRPLAGAAQTTVVRTAEDREYATGDWRRWIAPPPTTLDLACYRRFLASPQAAADLARLRCAEPSRGNTAAGARGTGRSLESFLVPINRHGTKTRSFWVHHLYGEVSYAVYLSRHLGLSYPVLGLEQVDVNSRVHVFSDLEEMAARYVEAICTEYPKGPYLIGGCSFGGVAAFEVARQLQHVGRPVAHLTVIDPIMPQTGAWDGIDWGAMTPEEVVSLSVVILGNAYCQRWGVAEQIQLQDITGQDLDEQLEVIARHIVERSPGRPQHEKIRTGIRLRHEVLLQNNDLLVNYRPQPLSEPVTTTVFHATRGFLAPDNSNNLPEVKRLDGDRSNGFAAFVGGPVVIHDVYADHFAIAYNDNLQTIAGLLQPTLDGDPAMHADPIR